LRFLVLLRSGCCCPEESAEFLALGEERESYLPSVCAAESVAWVSLVMAGLWVGQIGGLEKRRGGEGGADEGEVIILKGRAGLSWGKARGGRRQLLGGFVNRGRIGRRTLQRLSGCGGAGRGAGEAITSQDLANFSQFPCMIFQNCSAKIEKGRRGREGAEKKYRFESKGRPGLNLSKAERLELLFRLGSCRNCLSLPRRNHTNRPIKELEPGQGYFSLPPSPRVSQRPPHLP
jgi:hypothetical protein